MYSVFPTPGTAAPTLYLDVFRGTARPGAHTASRRPVASEPRQAAPTELSENTSNSQQRASYEAKTEGNASQTLTHTRCHVNWSCQSGLGGRRAPPAAEKPRGTLVPSTAAAAAQSRGGSAWREPSSPTPTPQRQSSDILGPRGGARPRGLHFGALCEVLSAPGHWTHSPSSACGSAPWWTLQECQVRGASEGWRRWRGFRV